MTNQTTSDPFDILRRWAASETMCARMGAYHPSEDGLPTVVEEVEAFLEELRGIENHSCDFGYDNDSCCGVCGLDPRS